MYFLRGNVRSTAKAKTAEVQGRKGAVNEDRVLHSLSCLRFHTRDHRPPNQP